MNSAVTSAKLENNISIVGSLTLASNALLTGSTSYLGITTTGGGAKGVALGSLLISDNYVDWSNVPTNGAYIKGNLSVAGDLTIMGTTTQINTTNLNIGDNIITLNHDVTAAPSQDAGLEIERGTSANVSMMWNETSDIWTLTNNGTNFYRVVDENYGDSRYAKLAGATFTGDVNITSNNLSLGSTMRQMVNLFGTAYAIGVQANTTYFRSGVNFAWYTGGIHSDTAYDPGAGGILLMTVDSNGNLGVRNSISLNAGATVDGVDISAHADSTFLHLTQNEKNALVGTSGTALSTSNKVVDNADARLANSRTPTSHGDALHSALAYFDTITDGTVIKTATTALQKIKFVGAGGASVALTSDASHDGIVTVTSTDNNNYLTGISGTGNGTITLTRGGTSALGNLTLDLGHNHDALYLKLLGGTVSGATTFSSTLGVGGDLTVTGNLIVNGTTTTINTATLNVADNIITLNSDVTGTPTIDCGVEIERGTSPNVYLLWNETSDIWTLCNDGSNFYRIIDVNYGDTRYMAKTNADFANPVTITSTSDIMMNLKQTGGGSSFILFQSDTPTPGVYTSKAYIGVNTAETAIFIQGDNGVTGIELYHPTTITGNLTITNGNIVMNTGYTVDGVDLSVFKTTYDSHIINATAHHSNVNDPSADQKAALAGTNGTPSTTNRYVTNSDTRLSDSRTPLSHADSLHGALAYFDTVTDGTTTKTATAALQNIKFVGAGASTAVVTSDGANNAIVTITSTNNYLTGVSGSCGGTVTFTRSGLTDLTWNSSHNHYVMKATDDRDVKPSDVATAELKLYFSSLGGLTGVADSNYQDVLSLNSYLDNSGGAFSALVFDKSEFKIRHYLAAQADTTWGTPKTLQYVEDLPAEKYLSAVSGTGNGTVTFTITNGTNVTNNFAHTHTNDHASGADNQNVFTKYHALNSSSADVANSPYTAASQTDAVKIKAGSNITLSMASNVITIDSGFTNTATAADDILDGSNIGTEIKYIPYAAQQAKLSFDTSASNPTRSDRLNLNGYLYATKIYSGAVELVNYSHPANHSIDIITDSASYVRMTAAERTKLSGIATSATLTADHANNGSISINGVENIVYAHPTTAGNVHIPAAGTTGNILQYSAAGTAAWKANGTTAQYLRGDGTWVTPPDNNTTYSAGTGLTLTTTTFSVNYGTSSTTACVGNDARLTDARTATVHGDDKHDCYLYARIPFAVGQKQAVWTFGQTWADYIVQITPNSPETHFYYTNKTTTSITICLDDEAYEALAVDVVLIKATTIVTTGFAMS